MSEGNHGYHVDSINEPFGDASYFKIRLPHQGYHCFDVMRRPYSSRHMPNWEIIHNIGPNNYSSEPEDKRRFPLLQLVDGKWIKVPGTVSLERAKELGLIYFKFLVQELFEEIMKCEYTAQNLPPKLSLKEMKELPETD